MARRLPWWRPAMLVRRLAGLLITGRRTEMEDASVERCEETGREIILRIDEERLEKVRALVAEKRAAVKREKIAALEANLAHNRLMQYMEEEYPELVHTNFSVNSGAGVVTRPEPDDPGRAFEKFLRGALGG